MGQYHLFLWRLGVDILGISVISNNYVNKLHECLTPTPKLKSFPPMSDRQHKRTYAQCLFLANDLLKTTNLNRENIREWMILDSGATSQFLVVDAPCDDVKPSTEPRTVQQPDSAKLCSSHTCSLCVTSLLQKTRLAHVIPEFASQSLLSVVYLCNAGCEVTFTKIYCCISTVVE